MDSRLRIGLVALIAAVCHIAAAQEKLLEVTLTNGKVLKNARVSKVEPDGLRINHDDGLTKVLFEDLPPALKEKYAFDAQKADMFRAKKQQDREKEISDQKQRVADMQQKEHAAAEKARSTPRLTTAASVKNFWLRSLPKPEGISDHQYAQKVKFTENMTKIIFSGQVDLEAEKTALLWNQREFQRVGQNDNAKNLTPQIESVQEAINKREERRQQAEIAQMQAQMEAAKIASIQQLGNALNNIAFQMMDGSAVVVYWQF